jgi:subtilase family serine protease
VFSLDDARQIPEMEELNNVDFVLVEASSEGIPDAAPAPVAVPSPEPPRSKKKLDLTVTAIKINGQAPDDKDDCKVGKNGVTVVVKNDGKADAGSFAVRLTADDDTYDTAVDGLRAGQQREVRFANVTLSKGEHTLRAVADAQHAIDESSEDTNDLTVTARCQG